jgi:hypothetical protein
MLQLVALVFVFAQRLNLVDQIKEDKQCQKSESHKTHRPDNFAMDQMTDGPHALTASKAQRRSGKMVAPPFRLEEWNNIVKLGKPQL